MVTVQSQSDQTSDSQQDDAREQMTASDKPASSARRETRGSKSRPTNKQPKCTHEADVSESESCCSVVSDTQLTSRSRRRTTVRAKPTVVDEQEAFKDESLPLAKTPRRSTRGQKKAVPALLSTTSQEDEHSEADSCSSVASLSTRITGSRRKRAAVPEDVAHSEADSCSSVVSAPQVSTVRRSTRSRVKVTEPIPINLEQSKATEASGAFEPRRTRGHRGKAKSGEEDQAYESEGCQSGPSSSPRRTTRGWVADSDSESLSTAYTSLDSPCSTRERGTPCSSRTGSASSNRAVRVSRSGKVVLVPSVRVSRSVKMDSEEKDQVVTTEQIPCLSVSTTKSDLEDMEEDANDKTVIAADQECSLIEDKNGDLTLYGDVDEIVKPEEEQDISSQSENDVSKDKAMETNESSSVEKVQDMGEESSSISVTLNKSFTGTEEDQSSDLVKHEENLKVLNEPEETVEASKETKDMVTDEGTITVDQGPSGDGVMVDTSNKEGPSSSSEASKMSIEKTTPVKGYISLLDSSEDDDSDDDDGLSVDRGNDEAEDLESEDEACCSEDRPGPSGAPDSLTGHELFVIDARPGCQPSEKYYIDTTQNEGDAAEEESRAVQDEDDFVDEEGDDDEAEDDEDTKVLFTTRKPALYEFNFVLISCRFFLSFFSNLQCS